jgi:predicted component of type VI protein secretion system
VLHLSPGRDVALGRERGDWVFPYDLSMSGQHADVLSQDADFVIKDAGSRNGVGVAVRGEVRLQPGARFLVGDKMMRIDP